MEFIVARKLDRLIDDQKWWEIKVILEKFSPEERRLIISKKMKKKKSLFLLAVENGQSYLLKNLMEACNVNVMETGSYLCIAAENGLLNIVKILVENGSDVNELDPKGFSPLYFACMMGHMKIVEYLLKNGAQVNLVANVERMTPLMASLRFQTICKYLLINGADPHLMNIYGRTALMMAVEMDIFYSIEKKLLAYRGDINVMNMFEKAYTFQSFRNVVNLLKSYDANITGLLTKFYKFQTCNAALSKDYYDIKAYWSMYTQIQEMPFSTLPFESEHPNSRRSCFAPILNIFNQNDQNVFLYLEKYFDLCNPYTLQVLATSMNLVDGVTNAFKLFSFILETLALCNNDLFFNTLPTISNLYTRLNIMILYDFYGRLENDGLELLKQYCHHVEEIAARLKKMSKFERCLVAEKIDYVFSIIANLIETLLKKSQGNMSGLKKSIEKIVQLDLRGSDNNTLLHFCTKAKYPVEIYKVLLLCKAEVNCRNRRRFTPVHYVLDNVDCDQKAIIEYFLSEGFLFDASIDEEFCLSCSLKKHNILPQPVKHTTLQCLAANVVGKNIFSYDEVPRHLEDFILLHT